MRVPCLFRKDSHACFGPTHRDFHIAISRHAAACADVVLSLLSPSAASECDRGEPHTPSEIRDALFGPGSGYRSEDRPGIWQARQKSSAMRHTPPPEQVWVQL